MNECPKSADLVLYAAGEMDPATAETVRCHLDACEACRAEVARLARGLAALALLEREPALRPEAAARIERRLERHIAGRADATQSRRPWIVRFRPYLRQALAAAAVLLLAVGVWLAGRPADLGELDDTDEAILELAVAVELLEIGEDTDEEADLAEPESETVPAWDEESLEEIELLLELMTLEEDA
jgi:anti-sigma factor RsiW